MSQAAPTVTEVWDLAHKASVNQTVPEKASFLLATVGARIAAAALGLSDARQLKRWASGDVEPKTSVEVRLDVLFRIVHAISSAYSPALAARFLASTNPQLDDTSPLVVLAEARDEKTRRQVLVSARAFLEG